MFSGLFWEGIPLQFSPPFLGENSFVLLFAVAVGPKSRISTKFKLRVVGDVVNLLGSSYQPGTLTVDTHDRVQGLKAGKVDPFLFQQKKTPWQKNTQDCCWWRFFSHLEGLKNSTFLFWESWWEKHASNSQKKKVNCIHQPMPKCKTFLTQSSDGSGSIGEILNWEQNHYRVVAILWKNERIGIWRIATRKNNPEIEFFGGYYTWQINQQLDNHVLYVDGLLFQESFVKGSSQWGGYCTATFPFTFVSIAHTRLPNENGWFFSIGNRWIWRGASSFKRHSHLKRYYEIPCNPDLLIVILLTGSW